MPASSRLALGHQRGPRFRWVRVFTAALLAAVHSPLPARPSFSNQVIWELQEGGYVSHFVYGIGVTWDDTILVACEGRVGGADAAEKDLLLKRSTDHGKTWTEDRVIEGATDQQSWSNPTFVTDGLITYLFYAQSVSSDVGRVFYRTTTDNGLTWSNRTELTSLWAGNPHGWTQLSSIGHGIKKLKPPLRGHIFVAFHHRGRVDLPAAKRGYGNDVIELTSTGWQIAGGPPLDPSRGTNEARLAERPDGSLYLMARQAVGNNQLRARSDGNGTGTRWSAWFTQPDLRGTVSDGGLLRFSDACHLYSFPAGQARSAQQRRDLSIAMSSDGGKTWGSPKLVHAGQSTYSDLARDSLGYVYCIYGGDGTNFMGDRVYLAKFNLEWLTNVPTPTIIIDDTDERLAATGNWVQRTGPGDYGGTHRESTNTTASASWTATGLIAGNYEIFLRWPVDSTNAVHARVAVLIDGQNAFSEVIDQGSDGATWRYLVTLPVAVSGRCEIKLQRTEAGTLLADAVMLQKQ